ncbi:MAG: zinc ribbon domain-containing protein, partial [Mycobacterium sp.]
KRAYLLRSLVVCEGCGRRMFGKTRRATAYYACQPSLNHGGKPLASYPDVRAAGSAARIGDI